MKIFISHSGQDAWAARRIAEELKKVNVSAFLDEKDIETGESINESVSKHLKECDDFLVLLSPASLTSQWVLIEIGGALILEKRVVPVLIHVAINEVPEAISHHLARNINEIERYYEEINKRLGGESLVAAPERPRHVAKNPEPLSAGDTVRIADPSTLTTGQRWLPPRFTTEMEQYSGATGTVTVVLDDGSVYLDVDDGRFSWHRTWLSKE